MPIGAQFVTGEGHGIEGTSAIFPIFTQTEGALRFLATGFFIAKNGVFATAKHVVVEDNPYRAPIKNLMIVHLYTPGHYIFRPVMRLNVHKNADVAIGVLAPMSHNKTGAQLENKVLRLTTRTPAEGSIAATFAYPNTVVDKNQMSTTIRTDTSWHFGRVIQHLERGRDSTFLPNECYRTDIVIPFGASGGPIADKNGLVFGVNSTGFQGTTDSYVSSIRCIFELRVPGSDGPEGEIDPTVGELGKKGFVAID